MSFSMQGTRGQIRHRVRETGKSWRGGRVRRRTSRRRRMSLWDWARRKMTGARVSLLSRVAGIHKKGGGRGARMARGDLGGQRR